MTNSTTCKPDYHTKLVYCGGCCVSQYKEYNQTLKLIESEYSNSYLIVSSSDWTEYNDTINYQESRCYCLISDGCVSRKPKPDNLKNITWR